MPDPYAAKGWPREVPDERRSPLDHFVARLRDLGAHDDEVALVRDTWDDLDPDDSTDPDAYTAARRAELQALPDDQLRAMILASRAEYEVGTTTEEEADAARALAEYRAARQEAAGRVGGNVDSVLAWVGGDPVRAEAVLDLETSPDGAARKTLVGPLRDLLPQEPTTTPTGPVAASEPGAGPGVPDGPAGASTGVEAAG